MNRDFPELSQINFSGLGCWLTLFAIFLLLGSVGLGWLVNGFLIAIGLLIALPAIAWFGFRLWLQWNLVEENCPVCHYPLTGINGTNCRCPSCGEPLEIRKGHFQRMTPAGTIDVEAEAIDVSAQPSPGSTHSSAQN